MNIAGRGVYVGDTLDLFNSIPTWYGEGDKKSGWITNRFLHFSARARKITMIFPSLHAV